MPTTSTSSSTFSSSSSSSSSSSTTTSKNGISCLHTAFLLQESISEQLETNRKVFITYLDVSKAFDGVWIDGLFFCLRDLGIFGKTWRLLYKSYVDFRCRVRVSDQCSEWYPMSCGIHQGGYLSLLKYVAFINSLLVSLSNSGICCTVQGFKVSPLGYADDIASSSTSKQRVDRTLEMVLAHSKLWRYKFNADKSAVLVFGESTAEAKRNSKYREYRLGKERVKEKTSYDHLGLKSITTVNQSDRILEKVKKGRKVFNSASGLGLKPGGLTIRTCSLLFWSLIIPIVTYAAEMWLLGDNDVAILDAFQRYVGRRVQRFPPKSPNETSFSGLGWIRIELYVYIKKLLFVRTVAMLDDESIYKKIFIARSLQFDNNRDIGFENPNNSPCFDILKVAYLFQMYDDVMRMITGVVQYSKQMWRNLIWSRAWALENRDWAFRSEIFRASLTVKNLDNNVHYLIWWQLSDDNPAIIALCETMAKLVCKTSLLKADDYWLKNEVPSVRRCSECDMYRLEDARHIILECPAFQDIRTEMFHHISEIENRHGVRITNREDILYYLLGKQCQDLTPEANLDFNLCCARYINKIYRTVLNRRTGIG